MHFPVGYRTFHVDPVFNFQLNRWLSVLPEEEIRTLAPRIHSHEDWTRIMLEAARAAEGEGPTLKAAFYYRAAEFFMHPGHPEKRPSYDRFVDLFYRSPAAAGLERERVPFASSYLPAMVLPPSAKRAGEGGPEKETVLLHGGFDSFMEELVEWASYFAAAGYRVIVFEGPGQGAALRKNGLVMDAAWERPVAAVLDHFRVERCTIVGVSLGGCLAPRAAAFEPRIARVVALDVLDDFFDAYAFRAGDALAHQLRQLLADERRDEVNAIMAKVVAASPGTGWSLAHGQEVSGSKDAYEFLRWVQTMSTSAIGPRITQDFLLLAGATDHIVPLRQFYRQAQNLPNARSFTGRVFSAAEHAGNHCQIGNVELALGFIVAWLDLQVAAEAHGLIARRPEGRERGGRRMPGTS